MKLHAGTNVIEKSADFEESKFSIEASSKAFFILSDGLYSNKIRAVVRELSTNAYDSHVEAGKVSVPFDVHIPTRLEPYFYVRDYGTSMTHDQCMQLYTTYFRSTRNDSNDAVGCLGLGSKAPFAYADSFNVEAYLDGTKRTYTGYKSEDGSPVFSLLDESETTEPNGIKVFLNVSDYDINSFTKECKSVYEFFNVKPNFYGENLTFSTNRVIIGDANWAFVEDEYDNLVIMGQIGYPINSREFSSNDKYYNFLQSSNGMRIYANIGDVDITPSREALSYSAETKNNIMKLIDNVIDGITSKVQETINLERNLYNARMKSAKLKQQCGSIGNVMNTLQSDITWHGTKLFDSVDLPNIKTKDIIIRAFYRGRWRKKIDSENAVENVGFYTNTYFVVDDLNRGGLSRIKQKIKDDEQSCWAYVYSLGIDETVDNCKLYDFIGCDKDDVILTSSLPKVEYNRASSGGNGEPAVQCEVFNVESGNFENCNMSVNYENAHYLTVSKDKVDIGHYDVSRYDVAIVLSYIHKHYPEMIEDQNFYLVRPSVVKNRKLNTRDNWHNATLILEDVCRQIVSENASDLHELKHGNRVNLSDALEEAIMMSRSDNSLKKMLTAYSEYIKKFNSEDLRTLSALHKFHTLLSDVTVDIKECKSEYNFNIKEEMNKFPMLNYIHLNYYADESDKKVVADYIDQIHNIKGVK